MDISRKLLFSAQLNNDIINKVGQIEKFQGKWEVLKLRDGEFLNELRHIATIQSIGSSTRIEGSTLSDQEVKKLIENLKINNLKTRDKQEVVGYWETLGLLLDNANSIELSERSIYQLHGLLLKYSEKDIEQRGRYKSLSNKVVAQYPDGSQKTIFNTTDPNMVSREMNELISWTNRKLKDKSINPLIAIGCFVYEFLSIHPFHDGNGRLSRLLTTLLLVKEKYFFVQYVSFEHIIEKRKKEYYTALMECQKNRYTAQENIGIWINFFLGCIIELSKQLEIKLEQIIHSDIYLNERQKKIVNYIFKNRKARVADISKEVTEASRATVKKDLKFLVDNNIVLKEGKARATTYFYKNSNDL